MDFSSPATGQRSKPGSTPQPGRGQRSPLPLQVYADEEDRTLAQRRAPEQAAISAQARNQGLRDLTNNNMTGLGDSRGAPAA